MCVKQLEYDGVSPTTWVGLSKNWRYTVTIKKLAHPVNSCPTNWWRMGMLTNHDGICCRYEEDIVGYTGNGSLPQFFGNFHGEHDDQPLDFTRTLQKHHVWARVGYSRRSTDWWSLATTLAMGRRSNVWSELKYCV